MHKRRVLYFLEPAVHTILLRQLAKKGFHIYPKVRLCDAIAKDDSEHLPAREFDYFTRAHLDFLIVKNEMPIFAVEFDGQSHNTPEAVERDVLKNSLCKAADLPLLRLTSAEIAERDQHTVLDYMLMRHVAWQEEIGGIVEEIREFASGLPDDFDPEDYAVDCDPTFHFDLRHPFPDTALVRERLWRNHHIAWSLEGRHDTTARYFCDVFSKRMGNFKDDQFTTCELNTSVWPPGGSAKEPTVTQQVEVSIRAWLPLRSAVPMPTFPFIDASEAAFKQFEDRITSMWFPNLPGISPWDVAEPRSSTPNTLGLERSRNGRRPPSCCRHDEANQGWPTTSICPRSNLRLQPATGDEIPCCSSPGLSPRRGDCRSTRSRVPPCDRVARPTGMIPSA